MGIQEAVMPPANHCNFITTNRRNVWSLQWPSHARIISKFNLWLLWKSFLKWDHPLFVNTWFKSQHFVLLGSFKGNLAKRSWRSLSFRVFGLYCSILACHFGSWWASQCAAVAVASSPRWWRGSVVQPAARTCSPAATLLNICSVWRLAAHHSGR